MDIPTDVLLEILVRLPWTSRRRLRLVCRSWRDLIHQHTTEMQQCRDAVPLVVTTESAYLLYDLKSSKTCDPRELWPSSMDVGLYKHMEVVGVANGVLCLCDDAKPGGAITLANPATGDVLALPPIPCAGLFRRHNTRRSDRSWHQAYSFGYHHATGQYKVVHVPCFFKTRGTLQVFTLGEASWREIPAPASRCKLEAGLVSANGATYWVTESEGCERIMCFDHESEQVTCTKPLPNSVRAMARPICRLTETQRRLSITIATTDEDSYTSCYGCDGQVWILGSTRKENTWIHQYSLRHLPLPGPSAPQLARPNFIHGECVLMVEGQNQILRRYQLQSTNCYGYATGPKSSAVHTKNLSLINWTPSYMRGDIRQTFAYIRNTDALSVYKRW